MPSPMANMTEAQVLTVVRTFLLSVLPAGIEVVRGEANAVSEPVGPDFLVLWPIGRVRLNTNVSTYYDDPSAQAYQVTPQLRTEGGIGIKAEGSEPLLGEPITLYRPGLRNVLQATQMTVQVDVHGPASADSVQAIATLFRDQYACDLFRFGPAVDAENSGPIDSEAGWAITSEPLDIQPLYTSDPRQVPFVNAEQNYEYRWSIDLVLQANIVVTVPQQFADKLIATPINTQAYPA